MLSLNLSAHISFFETVAMLHSAGIKLVEFHLRGSLLLSHHINDLKNIGMRFSTIFFSRECQPST